MSLVSLAWRSLANRPLAAGLTVLSVALSVFLLLGVEKLREGARDTFLRSVSGTDLIVGGPTSDVALLLHAVFGIGEPTPPISYEAFEGVRDRPGVRWAVPVQLGDGHRGYRVIGTAPAYFEHVRTGRDRPLRFSAGGAFGTGAEAVLGAEAAERLGYDLGRAIVLSHGTGEADFAGTHADAPVRVVGILERTGTPIDRAVLVPLEALARMHAGAGGAGGTDADAPAITAVFVGLRSRIAVFSVQRYLAREVGEPVSAVLPGLAFARLWRVVGQAEAALVAVSLIVVVTAAIGLAVAILSQLEGRRREMAILRAVGASPWDVSLLFVLEAATVTAAGIALGAGALYAALWLGGGLLEARLGLALPLQAPSGREGLFVLVVATAGLLAGLLPAWRAYRTSLHDGLTVRS